MSLEDLSKTQKGNIVSGTAYNAKPDVEISSYIGSEKSKNVSLKWKKVFAMTGTDPIKTSKPK